MPNKKIPTNIDILFKETRTAEYKADSDMQREHTDVGPSSLVGRTGDNLTFHTRNVLHQHSLYRMWHWAWKDLVVAFSGLFKIFFSRNE